MSERGEYVYGTDGHEEHWLTGERIVRCRDCKHFGLYQSEHEFREKWFCSWWRTDLAKPDTFCAWGKRKESE